MRAQVVVRAGRRAPRARQASCRRRPAVVCQRRRGAARRGGRALRGHARPDHARPQASAAPTSWLARICCCLWCTCQGSARLREGGGGVAGPCKRDAPECRLAAAAAPRNRRALRPTAARLPRRRFLNSTFGITPRVGWQIDPFGARSSHRGRDTTARGPPCLAARPPPDRLPIAS